MTMVKTQLEGDFFVDAEKLSVPPHYRVLDGVVFVPAHTLEVVPVTGRNGQKIMQVTKVTEIPQPKRNPKLGDNNKPHNAVSNPAHYTSGDISPIEFIAAQDIEQLRGFCIGNAIKYITRAGKKDPQKTVEDLEKAIWYIEYYAEELKMRKGEKE